MGVIKDDDGSFTDEFQLLLGYMATSSEAARATLRDARLAPLVGGIVGLTVLGILAWIGPPLHTLVSAGVSILVGGASGWGYGAYYRKLHLDVVEQRRRDVLIVLDVLARQKASKPGHIQDTSHTNRGKNRNTG